MICHICNIQIKPSAGNHLKYCSKRHGLQYSERIKFDNIVFNSRFPELVTKIFIQEQYIDNKVSALELSEVIGIKYSHFEFLLDYYSIPKRGCKEACGIKSVIEKRKKSCIEKYGVENPSQFEGIKNKKKETFLKNYGVDNIFKSKEFIDSLPNIMNERYGRGSLPNRFGNFSKWWNSKDENFRKNHTKPANLAYLEWWNMLSDVEKQYEVEKRLKNSTFVKNYASSIEIRMSKILESWGIDYSHQYWVRNKSFDFRINNTNLLIEIQGDYWHANPALYSAESILNHGGLLVVAKDIWIKDLEKKQLAFSYGYEVLEIWEQQFNTMNDLELFELVQNKLNR